ncbi:MAG: hypothetical protein IKG15_07420 [Solobacterium sp.]|nr:hypothetical protein [Solobacterium sp.]
METKKKKHILRNILIGLLVLLIAAGIGIRVFLNKLDVKYEELPEEPVTGQWYRVSPEGARSSDGSEWHGLFRKGSENKVFVFFYGGGVSFNEETSLNKPVRFYTPDMSLQDAFAGMGITTMDEQNPFKDWTFLAIEYASGDFHSGQNELTITKDGKTKTVYHYGYNNYTGFMKIVMPYIGEPEALVISGSSAGGFATSLLSDDMITNYFPNTKNITSCVDSSLLYYDDWKWTAENIWKSPEEISDKLVSDNLVLDSLIDLENKHPEVKILFACSNRDDALQSYQAYIDDGKMGTSKEYSDKFQKGLKKMVLDMQDKLDNPGIYIFEYGLKEDTTGTQHQILPGNVFDKLSGNKSAAEWLMDAVNGDIGSYGLDLLDKEY